MDLLLQTLRRKIEDRFGGYRHRLNNPNPSLPLETKNKKKIAVIGAGLAGLRAATLLTKRGFQVVVHDKNDYLGGKVGAWNFEMGDGIRIGVEHGFHAFFRHYYNLNSFIQELGITDHFKPIEDYLILTQDGNRYSFKDIQRTPLLNILSMLHKKIFRLSDVLLNPRSMRLAALLQYHPEKTYQSFDHISFAEFARATNLPKNLQLVFSSFARAFFAPAEKMSMAEVIKSFHFYFLSNDEGLIYDYPDDDYATTLLEPIRSRLIQHQAEVRLRNAVTSLRPEPNGFRVADRLYDYVVLATDVKGAKNIVSRSKKLSQANPELAGQMKKLRASNRYAVLRIWTDRDIQSRIPGFVITEHKPALDSVSLYHRLEKSSTNWVDRHGGGIFELHSYAVPDDLSSDQKLRDSLIAEFTDTFPEMRGCTIKQEHFQVRDDFTAFHTGLYRDRPKVESGVSRLYLAGDWVKLPRPAMLMEAATMSGLLAANAILSCEGLREETVFSVPPYGLMAIP